MLGLNVLDLLCIDFSGSVCSNLHWYLQPVDLKADRVYLELYFLGIKAKVYFFFFYVYVTRSYKNPAVRVQYTRTILMMKFASRAVPRVRVKSEVYFGLNRSFQVTLKGSLCSPHPQTTSVPQGSVISPIKYLI